MVKIGLLFSGQGAQYCGMGRSLYDYNPAARAMLDRLDAMHGDLLRLIFEGSAEELAMTENTQPAVFAVSLAAAEAVRELGLRPAAVAGFSLGELTALTYAGCMTPEQGFELVRKRASFMASAASKRPGAMLAVLRMSEEEVEALCEGYELYPANYNSPEQIVVSGSEADIADLHGRVREAGGRSMRLAVSGAFHSPLMGEAARELGEVLKHSLLKLPEIPVYGNVTGRPYESDIAGLLKRQVDHPVRWETTVRNMLDAGIHRFVETGPGRVLAGLVGRIDPEARSWSIESPEMLDRWREEQGIC